MNYEFFAQTHAGMLRSNNEDAATVDEAVGLAILADGMGGYNAGEVASSMSISHIRAELSHWLHTAPANVSAKDMCSAIESSVQNANWAVFNASRHNTNYAGMGTTLVMGVFHGSRLFVGHIGDSRCYRLRQQFEQITRDHSLLQEQLDAGMITPAQAATSLHRNLVTRALGIDESVQLEQHEFTVEPGDLYLLCSDGLTDMLDDASIAGVLNGHGSLTSKSQQLIDMANARGGRDNITVLLVQAQSARRPGLIARFLHPQG